MRCAALCKQLGKSAPLEWQMDLNRVPHRIFFTVAALGGMLWGVIRISAWGLRPAGVAEDFQVWMTIGSVAVLSALLGAILTRLNIKASALATFLLVFLMILISCSSAWSIWAVIDHGRARASGIWMVVWKLMPALIGTPWQMTVILLGWSFANDVVVQILCIHIHGDFPASSHFVEIFMWTCVGLGYACVSQLRLRRLYDLNRDLATEKNTVEALLSNLCDAVAWISGDRSTVLCCDERFDMLAGCAMRGKRLSGGLQEEQSAEQLRLSDALSQSQSSPVVLPISLAAVSPGLDRTVDCFIVCREAARPERLNQKPKGELPAYLIGIRAQVHEAWRVPEPATVLDDIRAWCDHAPDPADDVITSVASNPETTASGRIFADVDLARWLEARSDKDGELRRRLETIAELGQREGWLLDSSDVRLHSGVELLGAGGFGAAVGASLHGSPVAVKFPKNSEDGLHVKHLVALANEIRILRRVRHPSLVLFHGACVEPCGGEILLVLERIHNGMHLVAFLRQCSAPEDVYVRYQLLLEAACVMTYLHAQHPQIVHGDLKSSNILVEPAVPRVKLIDFGLARLLTRNARPLGGTVHWMAPEVITKRCSRPQAKADVFSFGRVAYTIVTCRMPLRGVEAKTIAKWARDGRLHPLAWPQEAPFLNECRALCEKTLTFEPELRPTMREVHREVSRWQLPRPEATPLGLELSGGFSQRANDEAADAEDRPSTSWQAALGEVRASIAQPPPGAVAQQQLRTRDPDASAASERCSLLLPGRIPTSSKLKQAMLLTQMLRWNCFASPSSCCAFHALLRDAETVVEAMKRMSCRDGLHCESTPQCHICGILEPVRWDALGCEFCRKGTTRSGESSSLTTTHEDARSPEAEAHIVAL